MIRLHEDRVRFGEALNFTEAVSSFSARLIEKDYYCTVLLEYLAEEAATLVFKGGTCLAKVYTDFYRLSEDLDFVIPTSREAPRSARSRSAASLKPAVAELPAKLPVFRLIRPLTGANNSTQYIAVVGYTSHFSGQEETIKIEVGFREPLLTQPFKGSVRTALLNPSTEQPMVASVSVLCMSQIEAFAEKLRAALSRREVAIRDFYDIDYAVRKLSLRVMEPEMFGLVREKLEVPGNDPVDVSPDRLAALRPQLESQLKAVLRSRDFAEFDLDRAFTTVAEVAAALGRIP